MLIPLYRQKELISVYNIYCEESKEKIPINRKKELYNVIKCKYKWFTLKEFNLFYSKIKSKEIQKYLEYQKLNFPPKYKSLICDLFSSIDQNNDLTIDLSEFKLTMNKLQLFNQNQVTEIFNEFDSNNDGFLSIDEFIIFLLQNEFLIRKLDNILNYKFEQKKNNDVRNILFKNFPGSPSEISWRPSLSNINSLDYIKEKIIFYKRL